MAHILLLFLAMFRLLLLLFTLSTLSGCFIHTHRGAYSGRRCTTRNCRAHSYRGHHHGGHHRGRRSYRHRRY